MRNGVPNKRMVVYKGPEVGTVVLLEDLMGGQCAWSTVSKGVASAEEEIKKVTLGRLLRLLGILSSTRL